ncbi:hypothetical protein B0G81_8407 [Paraburkholderia sp. BL6665CI2N2]|nr:hypothetical protein B0G81_8407 [Paraburkholderia sp. BL6665CI2N2]
MLGVRLRIFLGVRAKIDNHFDMPKFHFSGPTFCYSIHESVHEKLT